MREAVGESWTIQIIAAFILLFVAFLALMISYSKVFKTKNEVIKIIEKYQGLTAGEDGSEAIIRDFLNNTNYKGSGVCPTDFSGREEINGRHKYCIRAELVEDGTLVNYEVILFYSFNIPAIGNLASFQVNGKTIDLSTDNYYSDIIYDF